MANVATLEQGTIILTGRLDRTASTLIPLAILREPRLSPGAKLLYSKLVNYAWVGEGSNNRQLAGDLGISPRAVRNYVGELKAVRLLAVETRPGKPNVYRLATR